MGRDNFPRRQKKDRRDGWDKPRKAEKFWREKRRAAKMERRGY